MTDNEGAAHRRRLANIDHLESVRLGLHLIIERSFPDIEVRSLNYEGALAIEAWEEFDYAIVDLSEPREDDRFANEYPGIAIAEHIRDHTRGHGPWIIVVTGESGAYEESLVMRQLQEARADYFILRTKLEDRLHLVFSDSKPRLGDFAVPHSFVSASEIGVSPGSSVSGALRTIDRLSILRGGKRSGGVSDAQRKAVGSGHGIFGVDTSREPVAGPPRRWQLEELFLRARRIPRRRSR